MRGTLLGLPIDLLTMGETLDRIDRLIADGRVHQHVVLNAAKVVEAQHNELLREAIHDCDLVNADGMAVVWAGRLLSVPVPERVTGIDLFDQLLERAAGCGWSAYFLGARQEVVERTVERAIARHPGLRVAGFRNGYWTEDDEPCIVAEITRARPQLLFVALPSPRKEQFVKRHKHELQVPFIMGVGGSFDVMAGLTKRAPAWMRRTGLEWVYRLIQEPRRMFKRYLVGNTRFVWLVISAMVRRRRRMQ